LPRLGKTEASFVLLSLLQDLLLFSFFIQKELFDFGKDFGLGCVEVVVDEDVVELGGEGELVGGFAYAFVDDLGGVGGATLEAAAQLVDAGGLDEDAEGTVAVVAFDVDAALDIDVEDDVLAEGELRLDLGCEGAVEAVLIDFLVLEELAAGYLRAELVGGDEEVIYAVLLGAARGAAGGGDGEVEVEVLLAQEVDDGGLART